MNADPIAGAYRWLEYAAFGSTLERARLDFLHRARAANRILILGEGDGRFLARLLRFNPHASVAVIESSARMIHLARRRTPLADRSRVQFHQLDAASAPLPAGPFDLAVTHFFLDVFHGPEAQTIVAKIAAALAPGACWLVSEFQQPARGLRHVHARVWLRTMYAFFAAASALKTTHLPPYRDLLQRAGFTEVEYRERRLGLIRSQVWNRPV